MPSQKFDLSAGAEAYSRFSRWDPLLLWGIGIGVLAFWGWVVGLTFGHQLRELQMGFSSGNWVLVVGKILVIATGPLVLCVVVVLAYLRSPNPRSISIGESGVTVEYPKRFRSWTVEWADSRFLLVISDASKNPSVNPLFAISLEIPRRPPALLTSEAVEALESAALAHGLEVVPGKVIRVFGGEPWGPKRIIRPPSSKPARIISW